MNSSILWDILLYGTLILIAVFTGLTVVSTRAAVKTRRQGFAGLAGLFAGCLVLCVIANPFFNLLIFMPIFEPRVDRMFHDLKAESYAGRTKAELLSRFGSPGKVVRNEYGEFMRYDCRPWFALAWTEVVVHIQDGRVSGFNLDD